MVTRETMTLHEAVQEMASEMTVHGSPKTPMATIAISVQRNKALAGIDTVKVDTSARCRARTRGAASQRIVAEAMRIEEAEAAETQDVLIIRIMAVAAT